MWWTHGPLFRDDLDGTDKTAPDTALLLELSRSLKTPRRAGRRTIGEGHTCWVALHDQYTGTAK